MTLIIKVTNFQTMFSILLIILINIEGSVGVPQKHGQLARKLDEYFGTIKCMANIFEDIIPEYNTMVVCCGVWLMHDWLGTKVLDNCYEHNYHQINNMTQPFVKHMEENCYDYPRDSFNCKLMIITPIFILTVILILLILLSLCAIVTCFRLKRLQRYHEYQTSQGFDSSGTEETTDADPSLEKKKALDV